MYSSIGYNFEIWYLQGENLIIYAFALVIIEDSFDKVIEIKLLCSHRNKIVKDGKSLGIWLLDEIYGTLIFNTINLLKIQPATSGLIPYYVKWKTPSINKETFDDNATFGYLIYGNLKHTTVKCIENSSDVLRLNNLMISLNINSLPRKRTLDIIKQYLNDVVDKLNISENYKEQYRRSIAKLRYLTANDFIAENTGAGWDDVKKGGHRKNKKTTNYKNTNKKYKLTKHRNA